MAAINRHSPPPSPCNFTCIVDRKKSWCIGCLRTLEEIGAWEQMTPEQQWTVLDRAEERRASLKKHGA